MRSAHLASQPLQLRLPSHRAKRLVSGLIYALVVVATPVMAQQLKISTLMGPTDDCSQAYEPYAEAVVLDKSGNLYMSAGNVICKRDVNGVITRYAGIAGQDSAGYSGDDGPADQAMLNRPAGMAFDANDNLYFADKENGYIRKVDAATGIITTVVGIPRDGSVQEGSTARTTRLNYPKGVALDTEGNLFVADTNSYRVLKVNLESQSVKQIGGFIYPMFSRPYEGNDALEFNFKPQAIAVDGQGVVFIADDYNHYVYKLVPSSGKYELSIVAGNGSEGDGSEPTSGGDATAISLAQPYGLFMDQSGKLYIAERRKYRVTLLNPNSQEFSTVAGTGEPGNSGDGGNPLDATLYDPQSVVLDGSGNIYIADAGNHSIRLISKVAVPPPPITGLKTQTGDGQVTVSWDAPTGEGADGITGYTVTASADGKKCEAKANETSCVVTGLSNGTSYVFSVVAHSDVGSGTATESSAVQPIASLSLPTDATLPQAKVGSSYSASITPTGGTAPYHFRITQGALPQGLEAAMSADGLSIVISGTPLKNETANFTLEISDSTVPVNKRITRIKAGPTLTTATQEYTLTVEAKPEVVVPPPVLSTTAVPTLSQWALVLLSSLLAGFAVIRKRLPVKP